MEITREEEVARTMALLDTTGEPSGDGTDGALPIPDLTDRGNVISVPVRDESTGSFASAGEEFRDETPEMAAFLHMIARAEDGRGLTAGADPDRVSWNTIYGGAKVSDLSKHPFQDKPKSEYIPLASGNVTSAFGAFQITETTRKEIAKKIGRHDMSPETQTEIAKYLLNRRPGVGDSLRSGTPETIFADPAAYKQLGLEWEAFAKMTPEKAAASYAKEYARVVAQRTAPADTVGTGPVDLPAGQQTPTNQDLLPTYEARAREAFPDLDPAVARSMFYLDNMDEINDERAERQHQIAAADELRDEQRMDDIKEVFTDAGDLAVGIGKSVASSTVELAAGLVGQVGAAAELAGADSDNAVNQLADAMDELAGKITPTEQRAKADDFIGSFVQEQLAEGPGKQERLEIERYSRFPDAPGKDFAIGTARVLDEISATFDGLAALFKEDPLAAAHFATGSVAEQAPQLLLTGGAGKIFGAASKVGRVGAQVGVGISLEGGEQIRSATHDAEGNRVAITPRAAVAAWASATVAGSIEAFGANKVTRGIFNVVDKSSLDDVAKQAMKAEVAAYIQDVATGGITEGATEVIQGRINAIGEKYGWNPDRDIVAGSGMDFVVGAMTGQAVSTVGGGASLAGRALGSPSLSEVAQDAFDEVAEAEAGTELPQPQQAPPAAPAPEQATPPAPEQAPAEVGPTPQVPAGTPAEGTIDAATAQPVPSVTTAVTQARKQDAVDRGTVAAAQESTEEEAAQEFIDEASDAAPPRGYERSETAKAAAKAVQPGPDGKEKTTPNHIGEFQQKIKGTPVAELASELDDNLSQYTPEEVGALRAEYNAATTAASNAQYDADPSLFDEENKGGIILPAEGESGGVISRNNGLLKRATELDSEWSDTKDPATLDAAQNARRERNSNMTEWARAHGELTLDTPAGFHQIIRDPNSNNGWQAVHYSDVSTAEPGFTHTPESARELGITTGTLGELVARFSGNNVQIRPYDLFLSVSVALQDNPGTMPQSLRNVVSTFPQAASEIAAVPPAVPSDLTTEDSVSDARAGLLRIELKRYTDYYNEAIKSGSAGMSRRGQDTSQPYAERLATDLEFLRTEIAQLRGRLEEIKVAKAEFARLDKARKSYEKDKKKRGTVTTVAGREIPAPPFTTPGKKTTQAALNKLNQYLITEALADSIERADDFQATIVRGMNAKNMSQADQDAVNMILFGEVTPRFEFNKGTKVWERVPLEEVQEPNSVEAFEQQAEATEPAAPTPEFTLRLMDLPLSEVTVDPDRFQPRVDEFADETVAAIVSNYDPQEMRPITVWRDPGTGAWVVLGGHSRRQAFIQRNAETIPAFEFEGTEAEAIKHAAEDNDRSTPLTLDEQAGQVRRWRSNGLSKTKIEEKARTLYKRNAATVIAISHLNPHGKIIQTLRQFANVEGAGARAKIQTMAKMVGEVRAAFPELTDSHESEIFAELDRGRDAKKPWAKNEKKLVEYVGAYIHNRTTFGEFAADEPLNFRNNKPKSAQDMENDALINEARKDINKARRAHEKKLSDLNERAEEEGLTTEQITQLMQPEVEMIRQTENTYTKLVQELKNVGPALKQQTSLFGDPRLPDGYDPAAVSAELKASPEAQEVRTDELGAFSFADVSDNGSAQDDIAGVGNVAGDSAQDIVDRGLARHAAEGAPLHRNATFAEIRDKDPHGADYTGGVVGPHHVIRAFERLMRAAYAVAFVPNTSGRFEAWDNLRRLGRTARAATPIRFNRRPGKWSHGNFLPIQKLINLFDASNLSTAAHEVGHSIENSIYGWVDGSPFDNRVGFTPEMIREIEDMGFDLYSDPNRVPAGGYAREGFAEYTAFYLFNRDEAQRRAPAFHRWFEGTYLAQNPLVAAQMRIASNLSVSHLEQGAESRALGSIQMTQSWYNKVAESARDRWLFFQNREFRRVIIGNLDLYRVKRMKDRVMKWWVAKGQPLKTAATAASQQIEVAAVKLRADTMQALVEARAELTTKTDALNAALKRLPPPGAKVLTAKQKAALKSKVTKQLNIVRGLEWALAGPAEADLSLDDIVKYDHAGMLDVRRENEERLAADPDARLLPTPKSVSGQPRWAVQLAVRLNTDRLQDALNPYMSTEALRSTHEPVLFHMVNYGMLDFRKTDTGGKSLVEIFTNVGDTRADARKRGNFRRRSNRDEFTVYMWARRAVNMWTIEPARARLQRAKQIQAEESRNKAREAAGEPPIPLTRFEGRNPGLTLADAKILVAKYEKDFPRFEKAAHDLYAFQQGVLNYASSTFPGLMERVRAGDVGNYLPLQRAFDDLDTMLAGSAGLGRVQGFDPVKRLRGSGRRIMDPMATIIRQSSAFIRQTHEHFVRKQLAGLARVEGMGPHILEIPRTRVAQSFSVGAAVDKMAQAGFSVILEIEDADGEMIDIDQLPEEERDAKYGELLTFWSSAFAPKGKNAQFAIMEGGKPVWYEASEELYAAAMGMDIAQLPWLLDRTFGLAARLFRLGTTGLNPAFSFVTNILRDVQGFVVQNKSTGNPFRSLSYFLKAVGEGALARVPLSFSITTIDAKGNSLAVPKVKWQLSPYESEGYKMARRLSTTMATALGQDRKLTERAVRQAFQSRPVAFIDPRNWLDHAQDLFSTFEEAGRNAAMQLAIADMVQESVLENGEYIDAVVYEKDSLGNFVTDKNGRRKPIKLRSTDVLSEAQMLELTREKKQVTTDFTSAGSVAEVANRMIPFMTASIGGMRRAVVTVRDHPGRSAGYALTLMGATVGYFMMWKDDEEYQDMPAREKFGYWYFPVGGTIIAIPRHQEWGAMSSVAEVLLGDAYDHDPELMQEMLSHQLDVANPLDLPVPIRVAREQYANWQYYWERPIVSKANEGKPVEEQFGPFTSVTAIELGRIFGASPERIDHVVRGFLGGLGSDGVEHLTDNVFSALGADAQGRPEREKEAADLAIVGRLFRRGGIRGSRSTAVGRFYDKLETATRRARSQLDPETADERDIRLMLDDAKSALSVLAMIERETPSKAKREEIQAAEVRIAKAALEASKSADTARRMRTDPKFVFGRTLKSGSRQKGLETLRLLYDQSFQREGSRMSIPTGSGRF